MKKNILFSLVVTAIFSLSLISCLSDDDDGDSFVLSDYLIGTWKSYKSVVYNNDKVYNLDITKDGDLMGAYMEITLLEKGQAVIANWQIDKEGNAVWVEVSGTYSLNGNQFTLTDQEGNSTIYEYDQNSKNIYFKDTLENEDGSESIIYVYLRKTTSVAKI